MRSNNFKKTDVIFSDCQHTDGQKYPILESVLKKKPQDIINEIIDSGLKGNLQPLRNKLKNMLSAMPMKENRVHLKTGKFY